MQSLLIYVLPVSYLAGIVSMYTANIVLMDENYLKFRRILLGHSTLSMTPHLEMH